MNEFFEEKTPILTYDQRVRVFISSTIEELKEERNASINAVHDLKLHPVFFEEGARSNNPRDVYKALLEQSHIYIGIFWKEYGWIPPDGIISGIEDEYNLSERKPRLIYEPIPKLSITQGCKLIGRVLNKIALIVRTLDKSS